MHAFNRQQFALLVMLTLVWGVNWPIMKLGVTGYPPLTFRTLSMWVGLPVLAMAMWLMRVPFRLQAGPGGRHWQEVLKLATTNMLVWNICIIIALQSLSSGRSAILGYTMPIFSALLGMWVYRTVINRRGWLGVGAAALGVSLLLWHEFTALSGQPQAVLLTLVAAASWALGTQQMRSTRLPSHTLTVLFWMTVLSTLVMSGLTLWFEHPGGLHIPSMNHATWSAMMYNGILVFGFAQAVWLTLARSLPPMASTLSVMLIPVLGVFTGALWLGERLFWQDWAAMGLMVVSIGSVLWPAKPSASNTPPHAQAQSLHE
jgi:drug/metabolite transporter (DMT)-like permease